MTPALRRNPVSLSAETIEQIKRALIGGLSFWGSRTNTIGVEELEQPFFKSWKILEVVSPSPLPDIRAYVAWKAAGKVTFAKELTFSSQDGVPSILRLRRFAEQFMGQ